MKFLSGTNQKPHCALHNMQVNVLTQFKTINKMVSGLGSLLDDLGS